MPPDLPMDGGTERRLSNEVDMDIIEVEDDFYQPGIFSKTKIK
jgi:hypothetical protein